MFDAKKEAEDLVCAWMDDDIPHAAEDRIEVINKKDFLELIKLSKSSLLRAFNAGVEAGARILETKISCYSNSENYLVDDKEPDVPRKLYAEGIRALKKPERMKGV